MKKNSHLFRYVTLSILAFTFQVGATLSETPVRLPGHIPSKAVSSAKFLQHLDVDTSVPVTFVLPLRNREELEQLVAAIGDPMNKEHYGKYLTTEEFTDRFSPSQEDYEHVISYAKKLGLTIKGTHSNRTLLNVSGSRDKIEKAFNVELHQYQKRDGRVFFAPDSEPEVPASVASVIHSIVGLDNHAVRRTYNRRKETKEEKVLAHQMTPNSFPSGPAGGFAPKDIVTAYNLTEVTSQGSNQIIAMFELGSYLTSDITAYTQHFGLPNAKLKNIPVDGGSTTGVDAEVTLDIQLALALAPASSIYVYEGPNTDQGVLDTYNRIATDNIAKQVSTSWGLGEDEAGAQQIKAESAIFLQMAAHGQTIYAAAGDKGAYDDYPTNLNLVVDDPSSQPYVTSVGGTKLTVNATSGAYASESVWNDGLTYGAGGGGISTVWPIPLWQKNVPTVHSKTYRNVPDVALNADESTGYAIFFQGQWGIYGGTSCAAPLWAAFTARVNQSRQEKHMPVLGFANPVFYTIGSGPQYNVNFHDIKMGNNLHYSAGPGYDNASGWGSFNGASLFESLTNSLPE